MAFNFPTFAPPSGAIRISPGTDIQSIVDRNSVGTTFLLTAGVHRLQSVRPKDGMSFYGEVSADGKLLTTLNGANQISNFERSGNLFVITGQTQQNGVPGSNPGATGPGYERAAIHGEDVYINGQPLRHVSSLSQVVPGTFFFDYTNDRVYIADDPNGKTVEVSAKPIAFDKWSGSSNVIIRNLIIEKYASATHVGAINGGVGWLIEGNEVRLNHALAVDLKSNSILRRNYIHNNGYQGINGGGSNNVLVENNEVSFNNFNGFNYNFGGGGMKFGATESFVIRGNFVHDNRLRGIWFDENDRNALIEDNLVTNNGADGILYEISYGGTIRNNIVAGNGKVSPGWVYGSQILISSSPDTKIYGNKVEVPAEFGKGINIIQQRRGSGFYAAPGLYGDHESKNNEVYNNQITYLGVNTSQDQFHALSGVSGEGDLRVFNSGNRFYNNTYFWPSGASSNRFAWQNRLTSLQQLQTSGQESGSSFRNTVAPLTWSWPYQTSSNPTPPIKPPASIGAGTGLRGEYFDNIDFTGTNLTRTDAMVDFNWGSGSPAASIGANTFSARWTGQVQPRFSETYTFFTKADDGVRLWVNGRQIINNFVNQAPTERSGTIALEAGKKYDIRLEYYENGGGAVSQLAWSSPSQTKQIIPQSQLYTPPTSTPPIVLAPPVASIPPVNTGPDVYRIEGESFDTITGFWKASIATASGSRSLSLNGTTTNGTATFIFQGATGSYDVSLGTFDENDGKARFDVTRNGSAIGSVVLDQQLPSAAPDATTKVTRQVGSRVQIGKGDTITIRGYVDRGEYARLDFLELFAAPVM